jgi:salicylate hydroxylase
VSGLSVIVAGAGIAGLTTSLLLARVGHRVMLVERRPALSEVGAGLQLSPNASRVLIEIGLGDALLQSAGEPDRVVLRRIDSIDPVGSIALGAFARARFGAPYLVIHRADLQRILHEAVRSAGIPIAFGRRAGPMANPGPGASVTLTDEAGGKERIRADLCVAADGVWSSLRQAAAAAEPAYRGYVAWRTTLRREQAPPALQGNETGLWLGPDAHVVHYPIAGGRLLNLVVIERRSDPVRGWSTRGDGAALLARLEHAARPLHDLLAAAESWLLWSLFDRPADRLVGGRTVLVGDAGHPVLPFLAQGAALAIEDAAALAAHLPAEPGGIDAALRRFEAERLPRVRRVQREAVRNGRIYHATGLIAPGRDLALRFLGPEGMTARYDWLYGYTPHPLARSADAR